MINYFPKYFTAKAITLYLILLCICIICFIGSTLPDFWIMFGIVEVMFFFYFSNNLSQTWKVYSVQNFIKKLFWSSFLIRLLFVFFSYLFFYYMNDSPFEFDAADSAGYHGEALWVIDLFKDDKFPVYLKYIGTDFSDMGYPLYLSVVYYFTNNSILIARIIKALLSAYTCVLIYRVAVRNFGENVGRIAGIMSMLLPNFIYYCGLHVKETEMVFLVVAFVNIADSLIHSKSITFKQILLFIILGASIFLFRTVLAVCLLMSVVVAIFFTSNKISSFGKRAGLFIIVGLMGFIIVSTQFSDSISVYLEASDKNLSSQMDNFSNRQNANKLAKYGSKSIFFPLMIIGPLPTLVNTNQRNAMMISGGIFTRNVYSFFVYLALIALYKKKEIRNHILLISILFSYLFVLGSSGFALSERFHLPILPVMLIFAAFGISQLSQKSKKYYIPYLFLIASIIIGWNWFKLAGRGLI